MKVKKEETQGKGKGQLNKKEFVLTKEEFDLGVDMAKKKLKREIIKIIKNSDETFAWYGMKPILIKKIEALDNSK